METGRRFEAADAPDQALLDHPHGYFDSDLDIRFCREPGRQRFIRLLAPLARVRGNGVRHVVPAGFECDGGSIPRPAWSIIGHPLDGEFVRSCVVHDWLCQLSRDQNGTVGVSPGVWGRATRAHADSVFLESLRGEGVGEVRARAMYAAVRVGALGSWLAFWNR